MSTATRTIFIAPECVAHRRIAPKRATRRRIAPKITARRRTLIAGTGDIIARCREWGLPDPQWQVEDGDDFVMVMPRPQSSVKSSVRSSVKTVDWTVDKSVDWSVDKSVDRTCDHVLNILKTNPRATLDQVANVVGLSVRGVEQAIKRLKKAKRIRKVGGKRFGHWEMIG